MSTHTQVNRTQGSKATWAAYGVLATLFGMAAGHLLAALTAPATSPVLAVGSTVIDLTPTPIKEWAVKEFGTADKPILVGSVLIAVLILAAVAGILARRTFRTGAGLLVLLTALAIAAALARPEAGILDALPGVVTAVAGVAALAWLHRIRQVRPASTDDLEASSADDADDADDADVPATPGTDIGTAVPTTDGGVSPNRRTVLIATGAIAGAAALMGGVGQWVSRYRLRPADIDLPAATDAAKALPAGLEKQVDGITAFRTPNADFYRVDTRLDVPIIDVDDWTLTIDGDVSEEITLSFDDLLDMELIERDITLTCVSNDVGGPYVGGARWLGVRLTDLLDRAGVGNKADQILSTDVDGMTISTPLDLATDGRDAMIAIGMNGEALPREHGFPVRLVVPGLYGFVGATKWITRMTLTTYAEQSAYWTDKDWATDAPIKIASRIDVPKPLANVDAGEVIVGGIAWAQADDGIAKVQYRVDGGGWVDATLGASGGNVYWRQWFARWDAEPGRHFLAVRAISGSGEPQSAARATPFPNGSSGIQEISVLVK